MPHLRKLQITNYKLQILVALFSALVFLGVLVTPAKAQTPVTTQNTQNVIDSLLNSFAGCMIAGKSLIAGQPCTNEDAQSSDTLSKSSALGFIGMGLSTISSSPLSTGEALADLRSNLGFVDTAYAQNVTGSGANVIAPVKNLWQVLRNLSYMLYILLFLVVGLMIMFKQKMNPQTVISVQAALPGLVIGLILITFSYLIAALIVDLAFLFIPVVAIIFDQASPVNLFKGNPEFWKGTAIEASAGNYNSLIDIAQNANFFSFWKAYLLNISFNFDLFGNTGQALKLEASLGAFFNLIIEALKFSTNLLVAVVIIIALFIQMIRLFALLVRAYITIMVYTFLGPFMILISSIPGRGKGLTDWWKTILANSLIFPAVFAGFFFAGMILAPNGAIDQAQFGYTMPFFSGLPVQVIKFIIGLMILLGVPAIPGMVKEALGVKDIKGIPEVAMAGFGAGGEVVTKGFKRFTGIDAIMKEREALREHSLRNMFNNTDDLSHLGRGGWLANLRNRAISVGQPSYVRRSAAANKVGAAPTTSSSTGHS